MSTTDPANADLFGDADVIVRGRYVNQRIAVAPMEPHGAASAIDDDGRLLVYASTQMPHLFLRLLAAGLEARGTRIAPQIRRQLPEHWRRVMPMPVAAALYGLLLGLGVLGDVKATAAALAGFPVRVVHALGARTLFVSNAAGGPPC